MKSEDVISEVREGKCLFQTFKNESINFAAGERIAPSPLIKFTHQSLTGQFTDGDPSPRGASLPGSEQDNESSDMEPEGRNTHNRTERRLACAPYSSAQLQILNQHVMAMGFDLAAR